MEHLSLEDAVGRHVSRGDVVHVVMGHSRWTAAARELARQHWRRDAGFTLVMSSLSSLGALFFRGGMLARVVTAYSGDAFPTYSPNPVFQRAYASGEVAVEHWSFLTLQQRLDAAARGLPAAVTRSVAGSSMAHNAAYHEVETPAGRIGLVESLVPDVALVHGAVADHAGNVALAPPLLEGVAGVWAARRGAIVTVERVVDDLRPWAHLVRIPAHRVVAVVEAPLGAHPGGLFAPQLPVDSYGEDIPFWIEARDACRGDLDAWARTWCLEPATHAAYLERLGAERVRRLRERADPRSWEEDDRAYPVDADLAPPFTPWERAAAWAARALADRIVELRADAVLAGAGVANLAAWVAVTRARERGRRVHLTAELGLWDYTPTPADPSVFNLRSFPSSRMLSDASLVLGMVVGGPGTRTIACVGAAQVDRRGNLNATRVPGGPFLVGSGGGNDAVTTADEVLVVTLLARPRTVEEVGYVTAPGDRVRTVVTDRGILVRRDGELRLAAVPPGDREANVREAVAACGWDLAIDREVAVLPDVDPGDVLALRGYDRRGWFLGD